MYKRDGKQELKDNMAQVCLGNIKRGKKKTHTSCPDGFYYCRWWASHAQSATHLNQLLPLEPARVGKMLLLKQNQVVDVVRNVSRRVSVGVIYQMHQRTTIHAPKCRFLFWFSLASGYQFVKCEGKAGQRPSAAAVMGLEARSDFWTLEGFVCTLKGRKRKFNLQGLLSRGLHSCRPLWRLPATVTFWIWAVENGII